MVIEGLLNSIAVFSIIVIFSGVSMGIIVGAIPGLTPTIAIAILLPITFGMEAETALMLLGAVYAGSLYGGAIPAILINTPGTPGAAATVIEGYAMARKGEGGHALGIAATSSAFGTIAGAFSLLFLTSIVSSFAIKFGPPEFFWLGIFGLSIIITVASDSLLKGIVSCLFGLTLATFGLDTITGAERFTFGQIEMLSGISFVPVLIGLFCGAQIFSLIGEISSEHILKSTATVKDRVIPAFSTIIRLLPIKIQSSILGIIAGAIPGAGSSFASFLAYQESKRFSKQKDKYGTGIPDGVAASESANNAVEGGSLLTMMTLGIPGSPVTAIMMGALLLQGLRPGPRLFQDASVLVYTFIFSLFIAAFFILLIGLTIPKVASKIVIVPKNILGPVIFVFCVIGSFAVNNSFFDVKVMILFSIIGYIMVLIKMSTIPLIIGLMLGEMIEASYNRSMVLSGGSYSIFISSPITIFLMIISLTTITIILVNKYKSGRKNLNK